MSHRRKAVISTKRDRADEDDVIDGSVLSLAQDKSQIIRVFISSTFSDTCSERNILMEKAYPRLKDYCRQYDLEFQAYDLRWGIRDVSHDDHSIVDFCLREIEQCKQLSAGPSIVALIGQKYGYRPYPSRICADEFEMLLRELKLSAPSVSNNNNDNDSNNNNNDVIDNNVNNNNKIKDCSNNFNNHKDNDHLVIYLHTDINDNKIICYRNDDNNSSNNITNDINNHSDINNSNNSNSNIRNNNNNNKDDKTYRRCNRKKVIVEQISNNSEPIVFILPNNNKNDDVINHTTTINNNNNQITTNYSKKVIGKTTTSTTTTTNNNNIGITPSDIATLEYWYRKDTNVQPNVYRMRPISNVLPDIISQDQDLKQKATTTWYQISKRIIDLLRFASEECYKKGILSKMKRDQYFISVTEMELDHGIFRNARANDTALCFFRQIRDLGTKHLHNQLTAKYIDVKEVSDGSGRELAVDDEAQSLLKVLKEEKLNAAISDDDNKELFEIEWSDTAADPNSSSTYLAQFCDSFITKMKMLIEKSLNYFQVFTFDETFQDIVHHVYSAQQKGRECRGRKVYQDTIRNIILKPYSENTENESESCRPVVFYGESGCGKSVLMAKLFLMMHSWYAEVTSSQIRPVVVVRFLGTTALSCDIRLILSSLCWQISKAYKMDVSDIPGEYVKLVVHFGNLLKMATLDRPLILLLDSLDQVNTNHRAHNLAWLPHSLPQHVHVIITTLPNAYDILPTLKKLIGRRENFFEVVSLGSNLSVDIVKRHLEDRKRSLTDEQLKIVLKTFGTCTIPLYTALVSKEVDRWASYDQPDPIASTCEGIICNLFQRVEAYYGAILVKHFFSYISASKCGLSCAELEDVLSLDDVVLNDVFQHWVPPTRRIPPLLLLRLKDEMSNYIVEREANGVSVIYWYHNKFLQVCKRRYLSNATFSRYIHTLLAHFYLGTWSGEKPKPVDASAAPTSVSIPRQVTKRKFDRMVSKQPLCFDQTAVKSPFKHYNLRKLSEMPHHLIQSGMYQQLRTHVLFNYEWLHAKLAATSVHEILADCSEACEASAIFKDDVELQLVVTALRVGGTYLSECPDSLAFDLLGRLLVYYDKYKELNTSSKYKAFNENLLNVLADEEVGREEAASATPDAKNFMGYNVDYKAVLNKQKEFLDSSKDTNKRRMKTFHPNDLLHLLQQCDNHCLRYSALLPVHQCFEHPDTMLMYILDGHSAVPRDVIFSNVTNELMSISSKELLCWDLTSGGVSRKIYLPEIEGSWKDTSTSHKSIYQLFLNKNGTKLVVAGMDPDYPTLVYDVETGVLKRTCGSKQANSSRTFLAGDVFCQQNYFLDIRSGRKLADIGEFAKGKNIKTVSMSKDGTLLLISEDNDVKVFNFKSKHLLYQLHGKTPPSVICMSQNNKTVYVGYSGSAILNVFRLNKSCRTFALRPSFTFNFAKHFSPDEFKKHSSSQICGIEDIVLPSTSKLSDITLDEISNKVLVNVSGILLCVLDTVENSFVPMNTEFLDVPICNAPLNILPTPIASTTKVGLTFSKSFFPLFHHFNSTPSSPPPNHFSASLFPPPNQLPQQLDVFKSPLSRLIRSPTFSADGTYILATVDNRLCIWERSTGTNLRSMVLHTHKEFKLTTAGKYYAVTTSTLNSAIKVWDLREVRQAIHCETNLVTNCGPIRKLHCAKNAKLAFVENSFSSSTFQGIKQPDYFGLDVVDLVDGTRKTLLKYKKYGKLLQLRVTHDGYILSLLLSPVNQLNYVVILDIINTGNIIAVLEHAQCHSFKSSPDWRWMATESADDTTSDIKLWQINVDYRRSNTLRVSRKKRANENVLYIDEEQHFTDSACPTFLLDSKKLAFISLNRNGSGDNGRKNVILFCLETFVSLMKIGSGDFQSLWTVPGKRNLLMAFETNSKGQIINTLLDISTNHSDFRSIETAVKFTSEGQICDISKDGKFAIDSNLNIYNLNESGKMVQTFRDETDLAQRSSNCRPTSNEIKNVTLTYDGLFALWTQGNMLQAGKLSTGKRIGVAYLHEAARCLDVVEAGYVQVVGGGNGHLFVVRLVADESDSALKIEMYNPTNLKDRLHYFLDRQANFKSAEDDEIWKQIDPVYGGSLRVGVNNNNNEDDAVKTDKQQIDSTAAAAAVDTTTPIGRTNECRQLVLSSSDRHFLFRIAIDTIKFLKSKADVPMTTLRFKTLGDKKSDQGSAVDQKSEAVNELVKSTINQKWRDIGREKSEV